MRLSLVHIPRYCTSSSPDKSLNDTKENPLQRLAWAMTNTIFRVFLSYQLLPSMKLGFIDPFSGAVEYLRHTYTF